MVESARQCRRHRSDPWVGNIPWRRKWQLAPVCLPGKSHGHFAGRGNPSRARNWALDLHSEMNCLRRHMCWQSKRFYWKRAPGRRAGGSGNPGELLCRVAGSLGFYGDGISFRVVFSQSFWLRVLPSGAHLVQLRSMPERRILGGGQACGVSFWPFPNSSGWWWLISSVFLTRTSCPKTTPANGYCGAWPGWVVSVSALPLTDRAAWRATVHAVAKSRTWLSN